MGVGRHRSGLLTAGGVLTLIAGVLAVGMGISTIVVVAGVEWGWWGSQWAVNVQNWFDIHGARETLAAGIVSVVLGGVAIAGGISALAVRSWAWRWQGQFAAYSPHFFSDYWGLSS